MPCPLAKTFYTFSAQSVGIEFLRAAKEGLQQSIGTLQPRHAQCGLPPVLHTVHQVVDPLQGNSELVLFSMCQKQIVSSHLNLIG